METTYTYYVYHIPGVKIGCTTELEKRMSDQFFTNWEILWQAEGDWDFGWTAGDKEIELQKLYGLPVDKVHYQLSRINRAKGGESLKGKTKSKEHCHKLSESKKGKTHSQETKNKIREGNKGKIYSEETRRKISESTKGVPKNNPIKNCRYCGRPIKNNGGLYNHEKACKK